MIIKASTCRPRLWEAPADWVKGVFTVEEPVFLHLTPCLLYQTSMSVKHRRTTALTAATTRWAPLSACATRPTSWEPTESSATVSSVFLCHSSESPQLGCLTVWHDAHYLPWRLVAGIEMEIVNSCENNNGGCSHHCQHSTSGPVCSCNQGYRLDDDLKTCVGKRCCWNGDLEDMFTTDYNRSWLTHTKDFWCNHLNSN